MYFSKSSIPNFRVSKYHHYHRHYHYHDNYYKYSCPHPSADAFSSPRADGHHWWRMR